MTLQKTSLHEQHLKLGAKMAPFAGFDMPLQYSSVKEEVLAVREKVGVFDVSHMGEFFAEGPDAIVFIDSLITNDFAGAEMLKAVYSPLCREDGTTIDDLIVYKLSPEKVLICVNAANRQKDWDWMSSQKGEFNCQLTDKSDEYSLLAVQGPKTEEVLKSLGIIDEENIPYYSILQKDEVILARTGYTGEDGFEVFCSHQKAVEIWEALLKQGVAPCGLASRDVLRIEVCYPLYGHELSDELTPLDSALKWTVKTGKENFIGKEVLSTLTSSKRLVKLSLDKGIPREGYPISNSEGEVIGQVTSGTMSVTLGKGVALGHVQRDKYPTDKKFFINIRSRIFEANLHSKPFVTGGHK